MSIATSNDTQFFLPDGSINPAYFGGSIPSDLNGFSATQSPQNSLNYAYGATGLTPDQFRSYLNGFDTTLLNPVLNQLTPQQQDSLVKATIPTNAADKSALWDFEFANGQYPTLRNPNGWDPSGGGMMTPENIAAAKAAYMAYDPTVATSTSKGLQGYQVLNNPEYFNNIDGLNQRLQYAQWASPNHYFAPYRQLQNPGPEPKDNVLGPIAGIVGTAILGPAIGGAMAGAVNSASNNGSFGDIVKGGVTGGALGWAGGQITGGVNDAIGYNPTIADSIWSDTANAGTNLAANTTQNALTGAVKGGVNALVNGGSVSQGALQGGVTGGVNTAISGGLNAALGTDTNSAWDKILGIGGNLISNNITGNLFNSGSNSNSFSGTSNTSGNTNSGGSMADTTNTTDTLGSLGSALAPFLSAWNTYNQQGNTKDAYGNAINLITTPSPDQQKYRNQLSDLVSNPGSMTSSPVYQAMVDQGLNAVNRTAAANGMLNSGNRLADLTKFGQQTASQYYFPQANLLTSLSGVPGDQSARALGAQAVIGGQSAQNQLSTQMLSDLMGGFGAQTPQQQLISALLGNNGSGSSSGSSPIGTIANTVKNWFNSPNTNTTDYSNSSTSPVFDNNLSWSNLLGNGSSSTPSVPNYSGFTYNPNVDLGAINSNDYINSLLNGSGSVNSQSWF